MDVSGDISHGRLTVVVMLLPGLAPSTPARRFRAAPTGHHEFSSITRTYF
jgi:hypothetical protein